MNDVKASKGIRLRSCVKAVRIKILFENDTVLIIE